VTDNSGTYIFSDLRGQSSYTVTTEKSNSGSHDPAITSYDGALILLHVTGLDTISPNQQIAAEVSGDGKISSYDAALVLQYVAQIIDQFPIGADWTFKPLSRNYDPLDSDKPNQNYLGILYGDVSGNWSG